MKLRSIAIFFLIILLSSTSSWSTTYEVGPGKTHANLNSVPWLSLGPGDSVRIFYRPEPYRSKIGLRCRGTAQAPIRISGVKGANGELPVISGENAQTPTALQGFFSKQWDEFLGVFVIKKGSGDSWGYKPGYITFENLKIVAGHPSYSYTDQEGNVGHYSNGAAAIWAVLVENLTIHGCEITDNGNGIFVLSKSSEEEVSRNILIENNYIYHNGNVGRDREHNTYTQAAGIIFQYNKIGTLRAGAMGSTLKDRSSGTIIRYNWIESSARTIDLVGAEDSFAVVTHEPNYQKTFVYGNVIINNVDYSKAHGFPYASAMIHYGGDCGVPDVYRNGTLYFYYNTVAITATKTNVWSMRLFDVTLNTANVSLWNNVIHLQGDSNFSLMNEHGQAFFEGTNWITNGWLEGRNSSFDGSVTTNGTLLTGSAPGWKDLPNQDFNLTETSPCLDKALPLSDVITADHDMTQMYVPPTGVTARTSTGAAMDLGAFEATGDQVKPIAPSNLSISVD